ncbi:hypothetical protein EUTSA_v10023181mg [Eutrema salsugineum]|uniref:RNA polymerase II C-terminal domain phosphatase-like n=1 Tax=Eutrema salsugineum TaxID=72664 RepID=V4M7W4_EUTSA|nr:RNA polymerase II C-terminal domain phosphatase-like 4 [Eutrema salsugineum]ESQ51107.1 hypothetical protein EUTSA_v10023181mg [Eutrema salsugineum]
MSLSSSSGNNCGHCFVRHRICLACKKKLCGVEVRGFDYLFPGLHLSHEAVSFTKCLTTLISIYKHKKLHLVLDLDNTLVHSVNISKLSDAEKYLIEEAGSDLKNNLQTYHGRFIKIRPFVNEFLEEANKLFNMYVYTKCTFRYGQAVARMIDPNKIYFGDRVITRKESPNRKTLDLVLADERGILIVDDSLVVWPDHKQNLLQITRYVYFRQDYKNIRANSSFAEMKRDESANRGALANLLIFLKGIHNGFFSCGLEEDLDSKDVRSLIKGPSIPKRC